MKKVTGVMIIAGMAVLFSAPVFAADADSRFKDVYEETEILTGEFFKSVSGALAGTPMDADNLVKKVDKLIANSKSLGKSAGEAGRKEAADEAVQMAHYLTRIRKVIRSGEEKHELTMLLALYYLHYNNCVMVSTICLKEMQHDHVEELKEALKKNDMQEIRHLAEHLHVHSDQMHYAALIFGKKIWQKFSGRAKAAADEIYEAARRGDKAAVEAGVRKIEKPARMLRKLVRE